MGLYGRLKSLFRSEPAKLTRSQEVRVWWGRLKASEKVYESVQEKHDRYEAAYAGDFGQLVPPGPVISSQGTEWQIDDQVPLNLLLRIGNIYLGKGYDEFPSIRIVEAPTLKQDEKSETERFLESVMDDGDAVTACRWGMMSSFTRGCSIVAVHYGSGVADREKHLRTRIQSGKVVAAVMEGGAVELGEGMAFDEIAEQARSLIDPVTKNPDGTESENLLRRSLSEEQIDDLEALAQLSDARLKEERERPSPILGRPRAITFQHLAWGTDAFPDPTVYQRENLKYWFRRLTFTKAEFLAEPRFTAKAKREVKPRSREEADKRTITHAPTLSDAQLTEENSVFVVYEVHDRCYRKCYYIAEGYDEYLNDDFTYPYLDENGAPLFKDFFPFEVVVPIEYHLEVSERVGGLPLFDPCWAPQVETIKNHTAWVQACKSAGAVFVASNLVDDAFLDNVRTGQHNTVVEAPDGWTKPLAELMIRLPGADPPKAYLDAAVVSKADTANMASIGLAELSGEPIADTAAQEGMALQGAMTTQSDIIRRFERGFAGLVSKTAAIVRMYFTDEMIAQYGYDPAVIRKGLGALQNAKVEVRFASTTRAQDAQRQLTIMNFIKQAASLRNPITGMPEIDLMPYEEMLAKEMDLPKPTRWVPKEEDLQALMALQAVQQMMGGMGGSGPSGGGSPNGDVKRGEIDGEKDRRGGPPTGTSASSRAVPARA